MAESPFRVGGQVSGKHFTGRVEEVGRVLQALMQPSYLLMYGARRMGKSSTIAMAAARAEREGCVVAWADLSTATTLTDVSTRLLRSLSRVIRRRPEQAFELIRNLRPRINLRVDETGIPSLTFDAELRQRPVADQRDAFESVLDQIEAFAGEQDRRVAIVLDEFQDILKFGGERADWFLRAIMQRHTHVSYVCAGSRVSLIHEMLGKQSAFFKQFELLPLEPVEAAHMERWIERRMQSAGVDPAGCGGLVLGVAGARTQDRLQLAREVYSIALPRGEVAESDVEAALESIIRAEGAIYRSLWAGLSPGQQNALRAVASSPRRLYAADVVARFGLGSTSTMARAVEALIGQGLLVQAAERVEFDSPFYRAWVEREVLPDIPSS